MNADPPGSNPHPFHLPKWDNLAPDWIVSHAFQSQRSLILSPDIINLRDVFSLCLAWTLSTTVSQTIPSWDYSRLPVDHAFDKLVCFVCCFDDSSTTVDTAHRLSSDISLTVPDLTLSTSSASVLGFLVMIPNVSQRSSSHGKIKCKEKETKRAIFLFQNTSETQGLSLLIFCWPECHGTVTLH